MPELDVRYYPLILDVMEQGVFTVNSSTFISSFNKVAELITGFKAEEAIGRRCAQVFRTNLCDTICPLKQAIHTGEPMRNQAVRIRTKDGRWVPISGSTSPLVAPSGELLGGWRCFGICPASRTCGGARPSRSRHRSERKSGCAFSKAS